MKCTRCNENKATVQYTPYKGSINYLCMICYEILGKEYNKEKRNMSTYVEDDFKSFSISIIVPEGKARIEDVSIPTQVFANTPFDISYKVYNDGGGDTMSGYITINTQTVVGSEWQKVIPTNDYTTITTTVEGISEESSIRITAGHQEDSV